MQIIHRRLLTHHRVDYTMIVVKNIVNEKKIKDEISTGDLSIHNDGVRSDGTGSRRKAFTVAQRLRSTIGFYQVQGK